MDTKRQRALDKLDERYYAARRALEEPTPREKAARLADACVRMDAGFKVITEAARDMQNSGVPVEELMVKVMTIAKSTIASF